MSIRIIACVALLLPAATAQRQMEKLGRGVIAMRSTETQIYVGWRLLGMDPAGIAFNLYRSTDGKKPVKLNAALLTKTTAACRTTAARALRR